MRLQHCSKMAVGQGAALLLSMGLTLTMASPQSNYNLQDLNIEFEGEGLPEFATLDASVVELGKNFILKRCL